MQYYIEIRLLPDAEISVNTLWSKVFPLIHLALVEQKTTAEAGVVGLAWPKYRYDKRVKSLGNKLRLFAEDAERLVALDLAGKLTALQDYVHIRSIDRVPEQVKEYGCFYRVNPEASNANLARRKARKTGVTFDEAMRHFSERAPQMLDQPYIVMRSFNHPRPFKLFIQFEPKVTPQKGAFSASYGLTKKATAATVPVF